MARLLWAAAVAGLLLAMAGCASRPVTADDLRRNPEAVLQVLRDHPVEVLEIVEQGSRQRRTMAQRLHLEQRLENPLAPAIDPARPHQGPDEAPLTIVVYSNLLCSHCAEADARLREFLAAHPGQARIFMKHFTDGPLSRSLAEIYEAIGMQSTAKALLFREMVFADRQMLASGDYSALGQIIEALELDMERLGRDQSSEEVAARLEADEAEALRFGFTGTPTVVVNGLDYAGAPGVAELEWIAGLAGVNLEPGE